VFQYVDGRLSIVQFAPKKESNDE
ncbi:type IV conjugative transfer system protein TraE, partial [Legionella qingyii]